MNTYKKIELFVNRYPTKVRIYLSTLFMVIMLIQLKDILEDDVVTILSIFVIAPITIYYFTVLIFGKENKEND